MSKEITISPRQIAQAIDELLDEKIRLTNIIKELENHLIEWEEKSWDDGGAYRDILEYLQELKGENNGN